MNVRSVNSLHSVYSNKYVKNYQTTTNLKPSLHQKPTFKGDTGAALGIITGAAVGALVTAGIVLTGGLAAPVAAIGTSGVVACGAGAGTHVGGIIGSFVQDKMDK